MSLRAAIGLAVLATTFACSSEPLTQGLSQPIRVHDAQFREEELPGLPPLTADDVITGVKATPPYVSGINFPNALVRQGEAARSINGTASDDSAAVALQLEGLGSGYWLVPTANADALNPGQVEWRLLASFGQNLEPGLHKLLVAALDGSGRSGTRGAVNLCVAHEVPDNGNSCDPSTSPPALVVSLAWDAPVDLDLRVITPTGKVVDSKHASTAVEDESGDYDPSLPGTGVFDVDALAHCIDSGRRRENLVFQLSPTPGTYLIYADLYDACGEASVHFDASLFVARPGTEPETFEQRRTFQQPGQLQAVHATGGSKLGLFVTSFNVN